MAISVYRLASGALKQMRAVSPYDTGNLRDNGIRLTKTGVNEYTISIGAPEAPYAVYTNEKWVSPRWHGRKNPNEKWIDNGVRSVVMNIISSTGGRLYFAHSEDNDWVQGEKDRWINKTYWESAEGQAKLKEYGISDYKSIFG